MKMKNKNKEMKGMKIRQKKKNECLNEQWLNKQKF